VVLASLVAEELWGSDGVFVGLACRPEGGDGLASRSRVSFGTVAQVSRGAPPDVLSTVMRESTDGVLGSLGGIGSLVTLAVPVMV
jgi:hypothetical protein